MLGVGIGVMTMTVVVRMAVVCSMAVVRPVAVVMGMVMAATERNRYPIR